MQNLNNIANLCSSPENNEPCNLSLEISEWK